LSEDEQLKQYLALDQHGHQALVEQYGQQAYNNYVLEMMKLVGRTRNG
jgi:hypothetical protein